MPLYYSLLTTYYLLLTTYRHAAALLERIHALYVGSTTYGHLLTTYCLLLTTYY